MFVRICYNEYPDVEIGGGRGGGGEGGNSTWQVTGRVETNGYSQASG